MPTRWYSPTPEPGRRSTSPALTQDQVNAWTSTSKDVDPIGIGRGKAGLADGNQKSVALFGADGGFGDVTPSASGTVV